MEPVPEHSPERATAPAFNAVPPVVVRGQVRRSASIAQLTEALSKAQGEMTGASKDKTNPHFKSSYADLAAGWEACRAPLSNHGLAVLQPAVADGPRITVTTILSHKSGEWIEADLTMTAAQATPQGLGSCITYARRYAMFSMVGVAPEDDDGNAASQGNGNGHAERETPRPPAGFDEWHSDLTACADEGTAALEKMWGAKDAKSQTFKSYFVATNRNGWEALKTRAAKVGRPS